MSFVSSSTYIKLYADVTWSDNVNVLPIAEIAEHAIEMRGTLANIREGLAPSAPRPTRNRLTPEQRAEVRSLVEDSGYSRADAVKIVLAGGI